MRLILSSRHPRNSTYTTESGQLRYKVDKPLVLGNGCATIRKAVGTVNGVWHGPDRGKSQGRGQGRESYSFSDERSVSKPDRRFLRDVDRRHSVDEDFEDSDSGAEGDGAGSIAADLSVLEGHFAFYAQIEFHTFHSTRFKFNSIDVSVNNYFRKEGWSWFGRGRVFTASDGKEYRWELRIGHLEMVRNDETKTQVVRFREWRPNLGPLMKGRSASLEIDDSCEPILDEIMITFLYCHKLRKDRERRQRHSGSGGGGGGDGG